MTKRPIQVKIMLSSDERLWLTQLATLRGLTASDVLRQYIRREAGVIQKDRLRRRRSVQA